MALVLLCTPGHAFHLPHHFTFYATNSCFSSIVSCSCSLAISMSCRHNVFSHSHHLPSTGRVGLWFFVDRPFCSNSHSLCKRQCELKMKRRLRTGSEVCRADASREETGFTDIRPISGAAQTHLDLLEHITSNTSKGEENDSTKPQGTIAEQLAEKYDPDASEMTIPLGTSAAPLRTLTVSQKRNIRRQNYLNEVAKRNDGPFFAAVAAFILLPPAIILGVAVASGYVDILP
ncbi:hypothetical protein O6H91_19G005300 [Diphasiastrum complanatum]|uniref:Uncharacterized protein n=1 Tax=Diphasiastrum complanatum TaxID=34168 RepID=A0ACC2ASC9_DIPCM|nr:hypothetical protein O6H91_19G005300 [Diphasiastrum complanatum]